MKLTFVDDPYEQRFLVATAERMSRDGSDYDDIDRALRAMSPAARAASSLAAGTRHAWSLVARLRPRARPASNPA
jgi:hypothetical protein